MHAKFRVNHYDLYTLKYISIVNMIAMIECVRTSMYTLRQARLYSCKRFLMLARIYANIIIRCMRRSTPVREYQVGNMLPTNDSGRISALQYCCCILLRVHAGQY